MRKMTLAALGAFALLAVTSQTGALAQTAMVDGQVIKIDESAGKITIKHGPIKKFDMDEGMTMVFRVRDSAMLKPLKVGDKVKFEPDRVNGQFTVMQIQKVR